MPSTSFLYKVPSFRYFLIATKTRLAQLLREACGTPEKQCISLGIQMLQAARMFLLVLLVNVLAATPHPFHQTPELGVLMVQEC